MKAPDIALMLAGRIDQLVRDLLPAGHREGHEWRCGSVAGEAGNSLGVHLTGSKAGVWSDFSAGQKGDSLDLVAIVYGYSIGEAIGWSRNWLGLDNGEIRLPRRPAPSPKPTEPARYPAYCGRAWDAARPITGTPGETYLAARGLRFTDPRGVVLRYADRHPRRNAAGELEHHAALLALLSDIRTGEPSGLINVYLRRDGVDRLRDPKGKTSWGS